MIPSWISSWIGSTVLLCGGLLLAVVVAAKLGSRNTSPFGLPGFRNRLPMFWLRLGIALCSGLVIAVTVGLRRGFSINPSIAAGTVAGLLLMVALVVWASASARSAMAGLAAKGLEAMEVFDLLGEPNAQTVANLQQKIENASARGPLKITLDCRHVTALDPEVTRAIVQLSHRFPDSHFLIVAPPGGAADQALKSLGTDQTIPIDPAFPGAQPILDIMEKRP